MTQAIHYSIETLDLNAHLFRVTVTVTDPDEKGQLFRLPAWIPGSYMIREFARNIVQIHAVCKDLPVSLSNSISTIPTMYGGGDTGDVCMAVTSALSSLKSCDLVAISSTLTD